MCANNSSFIINFCCINCIVFANGDLIFCSFSAGYLLIKITIIWSGKNKNNKEYGKTVLNK